MAWSIAQNKQNAATNATSGTGVTVTFSSNTTTGNFYVVCATCNSTTISVTVTDSQGNSYTQIGSLAAAASGVDVSLYYTNGASNAGVTGGSTTVTVKPSATVNMEVVIIEIAGQKTGASPVDSNNNSAGTTGTALTTGSVTSNVANELLLGVFALSGNSNRTFNTLSGTSIYQDTTLQGSHLEMCVQWQQVSANTASTCNLSGAESDTISFGVTFKPFVTAVVQQMLSMLGVGA